MPSCRTTLRTAGYAALGTALVVLAVAGPRVHVLGLLQAVGGSLLLVSASAMALNGSRPIPLSRRRAVRTVLATTAANAATPAGVGGLVLTLRVHARTGLTKEEATAATAIRSAAGVLVAVLITAVTAGTVGVAGRHSHLPGLPLPVAAALGLALAAGLGVLAVTVPRVRGLLRAVRRTGLAMRGICRRPRSCAALLLGCAGVTVGQLLTLDGAVRAAGGHLQLTGLLVALMGSAAARSAMPMPGGVGPIEAALVGGLTALGMHLGAATVAVVVYRTAGFWLPTLAGANSIRHLRRSALL